MNNASLIKSLAQQSEDLTRDLDSFSDRAFELARLAKALKERAGRTCVDKATQVQTTTVGAPAYQLDRAKRLAPFAFQPLDRKINWRKLRALNLERLIREADMRSLNELYSEVAFADLERESVYDLSESNLLKLVRVMQLLLQAQQHQVDMGRSELQAVGEEAASTLGLLGMLPALEMGHLGEGLEQLQGDFYKVADADMDAMFAQVRTEERTEARDILATNVDQVKQVLDMRVFGGSAPSTATATATTTVSRGQQGVGHSASLSAHRAVAAEGKLVGPSLLSAASAGGGGGGGSAAVGLMTDIGNGDRVGTGPAVVDRRAYARLAVAASGTGGGGAGG